jgi:hypothetical protein
MCSWLDLLSHVRFGKLVSGHRVKSEGLASPSHALASDRAFDFAALEDVANDAVRIFIA